MNQLAQTKVEFCFLQTILVEQDMHKSMKYRVVHQLLIPQNIKDADGEKEIYIVLLYMKVV